ncbi:MAG TPA: AAA family ATPase [Sedimentisphaerales bacterium]|nr:AAA family ATPase [Sedimentisphaerales bacterium]
MSRGVVAGERGAMNPFELVLSRLPSAKPAAGTSQKAWKACCPAHADANPSLSITLGDGGRALIHCYAGCTPEAIVAAMGLTMADLMPPDETRRRDADGRGAMRMAETDKPALWKEKRRLDTDSHGLTRIAAAGAGVGKVYASAEEAVAELERRMGPVSRTWVYHDDCEDQAGLILRWDAEGGKQIRPVSRTRDGWILGGMPTPRPLYRLVELLKRPGERVYVTEGEKAADAGWSLGLLATTSPHGAQSAAKADWRALAGRDVVILPDNDDPGRRYADEVASLLLGLQPPATVRIVALPEIEAGEDLHDWLERRDAAESKTLRERLEKLVEATAACASFKCEVSSVKQEKTGVGSVSSDFKLETSNSKLLKTTPYGVTTNESRDTGREARTTRREPPAEMVLQCLANVEPTKVRWLWPGRIALGRITVLVGRPGEGKSFLTMDIAARVSTGSDWPDGGLACGGSVLLICAEDDPADTIRPRLDAHGADVHRIHLVSTVRRIDADGTPRETLFTLRDAAALEEGLRAHPDCRLVVVDPIGSFLGNGTDSHRDSEVRSVLAPVARLAEVYGPAVLVVAHRRKSVVGSADDQTMGSRAFTGIARAVWHVTRDSHNPSRRLLLSGKNNLAVEGQGLAFTIAGQSGGPASIAWESEPVDMNADDGLRQEHDEAGGASATAPSQAGSWLQAALTGGPVASTEIFARAKAAGIAPRRLKQAKQRLGVRSRKEGQRQDAAWYWSLPPAQDEDPDPAFVFQEGQEVQGDPCSPR